MKHARIIAVLFCCTMFYDTMAAPANASKADYCAAYARDFADARATDKAIWQHKYDIAQTSCMTVPKAMPVVKIAAPKPKPLMKEVVEIPPEPTPDPVPAPIMEKPTKKLRLVLEPGSAEWNVYCGKKYTSFNPTTGTYKSRTGVDRKCLVTG